MLDDTASGRAALSDLVARAHRMVARLVACGYTKRLTRPAASASRCLKTCLEAMVQGTDALPELPVRDADMRVLLAAFRARHPGFTEEWM